MTTRPTMIPHTKRQTITTKSGVELERAYVFMPTECWEQLQALCYAQGRSGSEVVQSLVKIAAIGNQKDKNDTPSTR
jgi:hypothetical protein